MVKRTLPLLVTAVLLQTACGSHDTGSPAPPADAASAASAPNPTCPANFDAFLPRFANDVAMQRASVTDPLQSDTVDADAEPEPKPVTTMRRLDTVTFPLMPDEATQLRQGLVATRNDISGTEVSLRLRRPDTDDQTTFFFRKTDCWRLYRIKDDAL